MKTTQITLSLFTILMLSACGSDTETSNTNPTNTNRESFVESDNNQSDTGTEDSASNSNDTNETGNTTVPNSANNTPNNGTENREETDNNNTITWDVSSVSELRIVLGEASDNGKNDIIKLSAGTYKTTSDALGTFTFNDNEEYNLSIVATDELTANDVKFDGDNKEQIFNYKNTKLSTLILKNISIINGKNKNSGAGVYSTQNMIVENCIISNNFVSGTASYNSKGGGLYADRKINIINSKFSKNNAWVGGASYARDAIVENSTFTENTAGYGGAFSAESITVLNSTFENNTAKTAGGAIRTGNASIKKSTFSKNSAGERGGSVALIDSETSIISSSNFLNSNAKYGGAIHSSDIIVTNSFFSKNSATLQGGTSFLRGTSYISNNTFVDNMGSLEAKGLFTNNVFVNNTQDIKVSANSQIYNNYIDTNKIDYGKTTTITKNNINPSNENIFFADDNISLASNSPVINKGLNPNSDKYRELIAKVIHFTREQNYKIILELLQTDKVGNRRIHNSIIDMGAIEFGSSK